MQTMIDWYVKLQLANLGIVLIMFSLLLNSFFVRTKREDTYPPCN